MLFWGNIPEKLKNNTEIVPMGYIMDEKFKLMRKKQVNAVLK